MAAAATPGLAPSEIAAIARQAMEKASLPSAAASRSDGRYTYRGATVADMLGITAEMACVLQLRQVVPEEEKRRRKAARQKQRRAGRGAASREEYLEANNASRARPWSALGIGKTKY